jgi:hypothetical protein
LGVLALWLGPESCHKFAIRSGFTSNPEVMPPGWQTAPEKRYAVTDQFAGERPTCQDKSKKVIDLNFLLYSGGHADKMDFCDGGSCPIAVSNLPPPRNRPG